MHREEKSVWGALLSPRVHVESADEKKGHLGGGSSVARISAGSLSEKLMIVKSVYKIHEERNKEKMLCRWGPSCPHNSCFPT